jgi:hypothetical protein
VEKIDPQSKPINMMFVVSPLNIRRNAGQKLGLFIIHSSLGLVLSLWCLMPFQQYFSYIVAVSFIDGGNQSFQRKPPTCNKSLTNSPEWG